MQTSGSLVDRLRTVVLVPFKATMNLRARRRPGNRHTLMAASPNLATHLETDYIASGRDWEEVARVTAAQSTGPTSRASGDKALLR
jgi:hypothetical protein